MEMTKAAKAIRAEYIRNRRLNETEEQRAARNEYAREWRKRNPDKVREARVRYWNKKAAELAND